MSVEVPITDLPWDAAELAQLKQAGFRPYRIKTGEGTPVMARVLDRVIIVQGDQVYAPPDWLVAYPGIKELICFRHHEFAQVYEACPPTA